MNILKLNHRKFKKLFRKHIKCNKSSLVVKRTLHDLTGPTKNNSKRINIGIRKMLQNTKSQPYYITFDIHDNNVTNGTIVTYYCRYQLFYGPSHFMLPSSGMFK